MKFLRKVLSVLLSISLIMLPVWPTHAAMIGNAELLGSTADSDRTALMEMLGGDSAKQQLAALGISQEQAMQRIARMTDQEIAQLNQQLADLPAGGDVLGLLLLLFIIFIITDAIGATDIFPFVHPVK